MRTTLIVIPSPELDELLASDKEANRCVRRHSLRNVPLKDSMKALSVGLPGREVDLHLVVMSPQIQRLSGELPAVIAEQELRYTSFLFQLIQHSHDIFSFQRGSHFDGQTFPGININDSQCSEPAPIDELIADKVQAPYLIRAGGPALFLPLSGGGLFASNRPFSQN